MHEPRLECLATRNASHVHPRPAPSHSAHPAQTRASVPQRQRRTEEADLEREQRLLRTWQALSRPQHVFAGLHFGYP